MGTTGHHRRRTVLEATIDDSQPVVGVGTSMDADLAGETVRVAVGDETVLEVRPGDRWTGVDLDEWVAARGASPTRSGGTWRSGC